MSGIREISSGGDGGDGSDGIVKLKSAVTAVRCVCWRLQGGGRGAGAKVRARGFKVGGRVGGGMGGMGGRVVGVGGVGEVGLNMVGRLESVGGGEVGRGPAPP